jgi:DNA-binding response OmpR family regulator
MPTEPKARILVVDDEAAVRHMLERALTAEGYEVVGMADGAAGLTAASTAQGSFDLVITNSHMPNLSGDQMVTELRRRFPGLPILHLDDLSRPLGDTLPANVPSIPKPFSVEGLLTVVSHLLTHPARGE